MSTRQKKPAISRRLSPYWLLLILMLLISWGGLHYLEEKYLPIKNIQIHGRYQHLDQQQIQHILQPVVSGGFFTVDVNQIKQQLAALSAVNTVSVKRVWPDTLSISIEEKRPVAHWNEKYYLDAQANIFSLQAMPESKPLPYLAGPDQQALAVLEQYKRINQLLNTVGVLVARLELDQRRAWQLVLDNGLLVILGRIDTLRPLEEFVSVYAQQFAPYVNRMQYVDLRYTNGFSVYWKDE
jgi:cell division protein FtsQ